MAIQPTSFLRAALLLPVLTPIAALPFGINAVAALLMLSLQFGGIQYLIFAVVAFIVLGRLKNSRSKHKLLWLSPLLFLPLEITGWAIRQHMECTLNRDVIFSWEFIYPMTAFTLLIGYAYVLLIALAFSLGNRSHLIAPDNH